MCIAFYGCRRERVIINKEKSIERLTESSSEQLAAIKTAEKEIEIRYAEAIEPFSTCFLYRLQFISY